MEAKITAEFAALTADTMAKVDAAIAQLRANNTKPNPDSLAATLVGIPKGDPRRAALPDGARIGVVGAESVLGRQIVAAIARGGATLPDTAGGAAKAADTVGGAAPTADAAGGAAPRWRVAAMCTELEAAADWIPAGAEARAYSPYGRMALEGTLEDVSAVIICTEAACGKGGLEATVRMVGYGREG